MNFITVDEIQTLAPQVSAAAALSGKEQAYINNASGLLTGILNRSRYGLEVRLVYKAQIRLSLTMAGILPHDPFLEWSGDTGQMIYAKSGEELADVNLAMFGVDRQSGVISAAGIRFKNTFPYQNVFARSPWQDANIQYHGSIQQVVEDNSRPFTMTASFRAGSFFVRPIVASVSGDPGLDHVFLSKVEYLNPGDEFYFDTDVTMEPDVDRRFVTAIDTVEKRVDFEPALGYAIPPTAKFRRIDLAIRVATASLIGQLVTYPPDTKQFAEAIGRGALVNSWQQGDGRDIMSALSRYIRLY